MSVTLVLGGARSGKSAHALRAAEALAADRGVTPVMIATGQAFDDEMRERIARHQTEREDRWRTVEAPLRLAEAIAGLDAADVAVVDCLTLWLTNQMLQENDPAAARFELLDALNRTPAALWLVSNEVGFGLVPETELGRRFRDEAGWLHQAIAAQADVVLLIVAGLPLRLKPQAQA
jgi:adenosylcobinamide kinase/adenosylcobinamide-phosphate guanylyltransferase